MIDPRAAGREGLSVSNRGRSAMSVLRTEESRERNRGHLEFLTVERGIQVLNQTGWRFGCLIVAGAL